MSIVKNLACLPTVHVFYMTHVDSSDVIISTTTGSDNFSCPIIFDK